MEFAGGWFVVSVTVFGAGFAAMKNYRRFSLARWLFCTGSMLLGISVAVLMDRTPDAEWSHWFSLAFPSVVTAIALVATLDIVADEEAKTVFRDILKTRAHLAITWTEKQFAKEFRAGGERRERAMRGEPRV
jgi:uncharacterized membrane protein YcjF (UPF0283 family)